VVEAVAQVKRAPEELLVLVEVVPVGLMLLRVLPLRQILAEAEAEAAYDTLTMVVAQAVTVLPVVLVVRVL
tara:strand:+ start:691 stop:903 length:213 start_codon:yes stop_codon:yes gene_type:complete